MIRTPLPSPGWASLFTDAQLRGHLEDLRDRQQDDGGWPISWEPPGPAAVCEWRGRWTLESLMVLVDYGLIVPA
jgi:hypothetical protein